MRKALIATFVAGLVLAPTAPALAAVTLDLKLNASNSVASGWTLDGREIPSMQRVAGGTPEYALRLTSDQGSVVGFAQYNRTLNISSGLDFSFHFAQWGGEGDADGLVFFIKDAADTLNGYGGVGGAQGYVPGDDMGVTGALLGVSFDAYGGFGDWLDSDNCNISANDNAPDMVWVRGGSSDNRHGYCLLSQGYFLNSNDLPQIADSYTTRKAATRTARIVVDSYSAANPHVKVYYQGTLVQDVEVPAQMLATPNVKIGFTAANGGSTNIHEVWGLTDDGLANTGGSFSDYYFALATGLSLIFSGLLLRKSRQFFSKLA